MLRVYRVKNTDMMGFTMVETFFNNKDTAVKFFDEQVEKYRKDKNLASDKDAKEHNLSTKSVSVKDNKPNYIKSAMFCMWYQSSYEYDEWDITVEHLELEEIKIIS